ncbi:hypothetical protein NEOLI_005369 [Neolecta irregularis DAH-3]|uniref:Retrotransposon gag domain-containing protein n=1 Tax=Neolecta irregularis (strain DAH-3) TaxID=1198029 RepID=A0A1U7LJD5_NEOID|nr:hypothetical protein NEOLI_005369 [Neolecta irregularis DAH-3]|eukprot:OLL22765.1 hypothetical protein NEOLI_005369 [Neolecta irregularis DAH-3]
MSHQSGTSDITPARALKSQLTRQVPKYSGKTDPTRWLRIFHKAAQADNWEESDMLNNMDLFLKKRALGVYESYISYTDTPSFRGLQKRFEFEFGISSGDQLRLQSRLFNIKQHTREPIRTYFQRFSKRLDRYSRSLQDSDAIAISPESSLLFGKQALSAFYQGLVKQDLQLFRRDRPGSLKLSER